MAIYAVAPSARPRDQSYSKPIRLRTSSAAVSIAVFQLKSFIRTLIKKGRKKKQRRILKWRRVDKSFYLMRNEGDTVFDCQQTSYEYDCGRHFRSISVPLPFQTCSQPISGPMSAQLSLIEYQQRSPWFMSQRSIYLLPFISYHVCSEAIVKRAFQYVSDVLKLGYEWLKVRCNRLIAPLLLHIDKGLFKKKCTIIQTTQRSAVFCMVFGMS